MEKKSIDWANLGFGYMETDFRLYLTIRTADGMKAL